MQKFRLVGRALFSLPSRGLTFEILSEQGYRFRQRARSDAEGTFNDTCFSANVARQVENCSLALA